MALQIIDYASQEYRQMLDLRNHILRAPLGLSLTEEDIEQDKNNILIGAFEDEKMLGCCMLVREGDLLLLRQMAVLNDLQGKGIGRALLHFAEAITRDIGYRELNMYARKSVSGFYIRMGYTQIGEEFIKVTIPHVMMKKRLF
ncbi:MAG TPA: GNAT family N-acetyltransferase [Niabella sp.]|nr:GNAT family N-acetyltransferase [Chitinophagaceae bacterium]HRN46565.1 GNAT family N-acetyltransferase [Niabella sp.]HRO83588.1 GNAT family N-acetyltransferase [Niabella sp.]HUN02741.1 GNAT family N-acetyltransferase [Niabella sp.]